MEALCYTVGCDLDRVGVFGLQSPIFEGTLQEIDNRKCEALAGVCSLDVVLVGARSEHVGDDPYHFGCREYRVSCVLAPRNVFSRELIAVRYSYFEARSNLLVRTIPEACDHQLYSTRPNQ